MSKEREKVRDQGSVREPRGSAIRKRLADEPSSGRLAEFSGDDSGGATPDPIPNSEVKPSCADGTAGVALWESRTSPGLICEDPVEFFGWVFFLHTKIDTRSKGGCNGTPGPLSAKGGIKVKKSNKV